MQVNFSWQCQPESALALLARLAMPADISGDGTAPSFVSRAFPSWNRSILAESNLCHACSDQEIEDGRRGSSLTEICL